MHHPGRADLVFDTFDPKPRTFHKSAVLEVMKECKEYNIKPYEIDNFDILLCNYISPQLEQPGRDGRGHVNIVMSTICYYLPKLKDAKRSLRRSHKAVTGLARSQPSQQMTCCHKTLL